MSEFSSELAETEHLISLATFSGIKALLQAHAAKLKKAEAERINRENATTAASVASSSTNSASVEKLSSTSAAPLFKGTFIPIEGYAWDQGEYNSPVVSIFIDLDGVGTVKDRVEVNFTKSSFDLKVTDLNGKNYRLYKDNLEKNIVPDKSKFIVKSNKIVLKLQKVKGEFSYDHWSSLTAKKKKTEDAVADTKKDPMGGTFNSIII